MLFRSGERLADWAYALVVENGHQQYDRFPALDAAWPRIAAALPVLLAGDNLRLQAAGDALNSFLDFSGRWDDGLALGIAAEARAVLARDHGKAGWRAQQLGYLHLLRGQSADVLTCADRAAEHWATAHTGARERAVALRLRGRGHHVAKDYLAAMDTTREALGLFRSVSNESDDVAICLNDLGATQQACFQYGEAESSFSEALAMASALADREGIAIYTGNLAELAIHREQWPEAEGLARQALLLAEKLGRQELIASAERRCGAQQ